VCRFVRHRSLAAVKQILLNKTNRFGRLMSAAIFRHNSKKEMSMSSAPRLCLTPMVCFLTSQRKLTLLACLLVAPVLGSESPICVTGGVCPTPTTLGSGGSTSGTFNFTYVAADGDWFTISGNYQATNPASGNTSITFNVDAKYVGFGGVNSSASAGADTFTVTYRQDYDLALSNYFAEFGTLDGFYTEDTHSSITGAPGGSWQAQLFYNGQALPVLGPFTGPSFASNGSGTALTGFGSSSTLDAAYVFTYDFRAGTPAGSGFSSTAADPIPPTPAPSSLLLIIVGMLVLMLFWRGARSTFGC